MPQEQFFGENEDKLSLQDTNLIQIHLAQEAGQDLMNWIENNSAKFRQILKNHPELGELYHANPKEAEMLIKQALEDMPDEPVH